MLAFFETRSWWLLPAILTGAGIWSLIFKAIF